MPVKRDIRLLVSDIDNTILRSDGTIAPETTAAFERAARAGMRTVLASSRTVDSARFLLDKVGELTHMIMLTGCVLTDVKTGECLLHRSIDQGTARELLAYADTAGPCYFEACGGGRYVLARKSLDYVRSRGIFSRYLEDLSACLTVVDSLGEYFAATGTPVDKMFLYSAEPGQQERLASALPGRGRLQLVSPVPNGLDILPRDEQRRRATGAAPAAGAARGAGDGLRRQRERRGDVSARRAQGRRGQRLPLAQGPGGLRLPHERRARRGLRNRRAGAELRRY